MRSLRLKLILGSLLLLAAVILAFDVFIYVARRRALMEVLDGRLYSGTQSIALRLEIDSGRPVFDPADEAEPQPDPPRRFRITDDRGRIVSQSPAPGGPAWPPASTTPPNPRWTTTGSGREAWRIATWVHRFDIDTEAAEEEPARPGMPVSAVIQCAEPLAGTTEEMRELASLLAIVSLAAFLIAGGGSFLLAGRALRPVRRINEALADVSETRLDGRLNPASFDVELHPLIGQLNAALDRLEKGFRRERQFTADASHELRTPVAAILSSIEVLLRRPRTERELVEAHEDNLRTARTMQAVIEGLLLLARMDAGKSRPEKESVPLAGLVEDLLAASGAEAEKRGVARGHDIDPELRVPADPAQLRLALVNLIDNAIRYNKRGGSLAVHARREGAVFVIEVRDTGIGIPAEHLPRIFERFYRVDPSRAEATGGSGLGLSIVRKIVEAHGGGVSASSSGDGSVFTVVLPAD